MATSGDINWPPPGTSTGHQRELSHGHGQVAEALAACGYEITSDEADQTDDEATTATTFGQGWTDSDIEEALGGMEDADDPDVAACFVAYVAERYTPEELEDISAADLFELQDAVQAQCQ